MPLLIAACLYLALNLSAFGVMVFDKARARRQGRRVPERTLFKLAAFGGALGCLAGMYAVRHKTKHASFVYGMPALLVLNLSVLAAAAYLIYR